MCAQGEVLPKPGDRAVVPTGILMVCLSVLMVGRLTGSPGTVGFKDHPGPGDTDHFLPRAGHGTRPRAGLLTDPRNPRAPRSHTGRDTRSPARASRACTCRGPPPRPPHRQLAVVSKETLSPSWVAESQRSPASAGQAPEPAWGSGCWWAPAGCRRDSWWAAGASGGWGRAPRDTAEAGTVHPHKSPRELKALPPQILKREEEDPPAVPAPPQPRRPAARVSSTHRRHPFVGCLRSGQQQLRRGEG